MKQNTNLKFHHIIWIENNLWLDRKIMFSFHLSSHSPSFVMLWHKILMSFHMKELAEARKIDMTKGDACQDKWWNACSSNVTIRMVNQRICRSIILLWSMGCSWYILCRNVSTGLSVRTHRNRPDQTRLDQARPD